VDGNIPLLPNDRANLNHIDEYFKNVSKIPAQLGIVQKDLGAYYTDRGIVSFIISQLHFSENTTVLDPACGCGSFIFPLYQLAGSGMGPLPSNIYGMDIDPKAVDFTKTLLSIMGKEDPQAFSNNIIEGDFVFGAFTPVSNQPKWSEKFSYILKKGGFNYIIGNPPYNVKDVTKKKVTLTSDIHKKISGEAKNMPIYFILKALELLRDEGTVSFILPKSLLYVRKYQKFRMYLLKHHTILKITEIGIKFKGVRGEQIVIFIKKQEPDKNSQIIFSSLRDKSSNREESSFSIPQKYFETMGSIPVWSSKDIYDVVERINSCCSKKISTITDIEVLRGMPASNKKITVTKALDTGKAIDLYFVRGKDIGKAEIKKFCTSKFNGGPLSRRERIRMPKIILQNIYSSESGIMSYLDETGILTTETVTNILIPDPHLRKFVFGILNSKLLNFYLFYAIFSQSRLTMHMDRYYIGQLPIIWNPELHETKEIMKLVDKMMLENKKNMKTILREIDKEVYALFNLSKSEINIIEDSMSKVLSPRSMW